MLTFRDSKKCYHGDSVPMGATNVIVDVTDREIKRIIFVLAGRDADGRLVTAEDYRNKR